MRLDIWFLVYSVLTLTANDQLASSTEDLISGVHKAISAKEDEGPSSMRMTSNVLRRGDQGEKWQRPSIRSVHCE